MIEYSLVQDTISWNLDEYPSIFFFSRCTPSACTERDRKVMRSRLINIYNIYFQLAHWLRPWDRRHTLHYPDVCIVDLFLCIIMFVGVCFDSFSVSCHVTRPLILSESFQTPMCSWTTENRSQMLFISGANRSQLSANSWSASEKTRRQVRRGVLPVPSLPRWPPFLYLPTSLKILCNVPTASIFKSTLFKTYPIFKRFLHLIYPRFIIVIQLALPESHKQYFFPYINTWQRTWKYTVIYFFFSERLFL